MNNYDRGRAFEHMVRNDLTANGYDVIRSAGSKTKIDLAAFKPGQALFIQAKRDGALPPIERVELLRLARLIDAVPILAHKRVGSTVVLYARLTGPGPKDREPWTPDAEETAA